MIKTKNTTGKSRVEGGKKSTTIRNNEESIEKHTLVEALEEEIKAMGVRSVVDFDEAVIPRVLRPLRSGISDGRGGAVYKVGGPESKRGELHFGFEKVGFALGHTFGRKDGVNVAEIVHSRINTLSSLGSSVHFQKETGGLLCHDVAVTFSSGDVHIRLKDLRQSTGQCVPMATTRAAALFHSVGSNAGAQTLQTSTRGMNSGKMTGVALFEFFQGVLKLCHQVLRAESHCIRSSQKREQTVLLRLVVENLLLQLCRLGKLAFGWELSTDRSIPNSDCQAAGQFTGSAVVL